MNHDMLNPSAYFKLQRRSLSVATLALFLASAAFVSGQSSTITITFEDAFQQISTSGGVNPGYGADGTQVIMDNLTVTEVPEPSTVACAVLGSALFLRFRKKRCASRVG